jgi:hypothetical protein
MKHIINLFGESKRIFACSIPNDTYFRLEKLRLKHGLSVEDFYLNLEILEHLGYSTEKTWLLKVQKQKLMKRI